MKIVRLSFFSTFVILTMYSILYYAYSDFPNFFVQNFEEARKEVIERNYLLLTEGCKVPKYDPFDPTVIEYYSERSGDIPCKGKKYLDVDDNRVILLTDDFKKDFENDTIACVYKPIIRNPKNSTLRADNKIEYGDEGELKMGELLPSEFVNVVCKVHDEVVYEDFLAATPLKAGVEKRCEEKWSKQNISNKLNIIVIGIDSVSKLNFERHFKLTVEYLRKNLSTFEFHGYIKVADNTIPNLTPLLTGHFIEHYYTSSNQDRYFDDLDFIWKNFSSLGYRTLFTEDAPAMATYNHKKKGFQYPPSDYFFRPFTLAIEDSPWWKSSKTDCFQAKPEIRVLFDYLRSFLSTMKNRPFFAFTWAARLTHDYLNKAGLADKPSFELLRDINEMGLLNTSMLIFMSDHGIRFGDIRKTYIGKIEERMPFLFLSFPPWFLKTYPKVAKYLEINQKRLTTPFDVHETLVDVYQIISGKLDYSSTPYGKSLFREIPLERNCKTAYILPHWCVCHDYRKMSTDEILSIRAANSLLEKVNNLTHPYRNVCAFLKIDKVLDVRASIPITVMLKLDELKYSGDENFIVYGEKTNPYVELLVTVKANPGGAEFESTIRSFRDRSEVLGVSRINKYGNQGDCVNDSDLQKYCYCY
ncbi:LOW QUALITY PROTEIN: uncharacterized protein LOC129227876 [Uloborus diversus]|uniref:LOW QUALITY PROTEIN: uncharacterized protein LOC129227876 n=1 Tax=Uloborus diversus TaxID=327109 RepID=UPI0024094E79|nr:LOW QUALITY PROTEIN: uncharacterized protein LOC129227876 [Uloborus diversus]